LQTVTTVGYGDVAPQQLGGRLVGAVVMLEGTAFIAILTAVITSTFITRATRKNEVMRAQETPSDVERIERRLDALERKLDVLVAAQDARGPDDEPARRRL
jgi:voltage-gated potassium channel